MAPTSVSHGPLCLSHAAPKLRFPQGALPRERRPLIPFPCQLGAASARPSEPFLTGPKTDQNEPENRPEPCE